MTSDYYKTLELSPDCTDEEIKTSYRRLAKLHHPDLHGAQTGEQMRLLNEAYAVLGERERRLAYDSQHRAIPRPYRVSSVPRKSRGTDEYVLVTRWLIEVYQPVNRLLNQILSPLSRQLEALAYDPYDDDYIGDFQEYLDRCERAYTQAWRCYTDQPNPALTARIAEYLYHALNHMRDGLDELGYFCQNYDYSHLHTELFSIAIEMRDKAAFAASKLHNR
ncbi:J domain-containing protein [Anthocerotibacter panamensis]|uniref:J domain-containing protein n=1 Tax=Anthocerotibacter panamensis TaxID=2857077 RepID=UPI001C405072|nr:J domain-containing protein [Anthocerotibacter panamensis]